jgi:tRNA1(Val) A37 N6-methylase TrmN6
MNDELTEDHLTVEWKILQRKHGHRHSTDDLLTAWFAAEKTAPDRKTLLDLGAGIGTVGLLLLWRSPDARLTCIEAQEVSFGLLAKNIERNGLGDRVRAIHGDLRHVRLERETFDVVTGSPPYFDPKDGIVSADSQRAHARFELRGDVRDYCAAAYAALAPGGRFVFCFPTNQRARAEKAVAEAELAVVTSRDVIPRRGGAPHFSLFSCRRRPCLTSEAGRRDDGGAPSEPTLEAPSSSSRSLRELDSSSSRSLRELDYVVRDEAGEPTAEHARARATFGFR